MNDEETIKWLLDIIEKMKCCGNCWHHNYDCFSNVVIQHRDKDWKGEQIPCKNYNQWHLR